MTDLRDAIWSKSSYSSGQGECVEAALTWRKSSYSGGQGGECLEVASAPDLVPVRDSKDPHGPALFFPPDAWTAFLSDVKSGRFTG